MTEYLRSLATSEGFMPHGMCYMWDPPLLWLHLVSDALTGLAYFAIPPALFALVWKAQRELSGDSRYTPDGGLPYAWMFVAFGIFIVACGTTHLLGVWTIWNPAYWVSGGAKAVTAVASVATAIALPPLIPRVVQLLQDARQSEARRVRLEVANDELKALSDRLRDANRLKSELVANVSHELRTPLSLILGPAEELLREQNLSDDVRRGLEVMQRSARSLLGQVDDLLDASRLDLDQARPTFEGVELVAWTARLVEPFESLARSRSIDLALEGPEELPCRVDPEMTERIVLNLLSNAVKFTPEGGEIRVGLGTSSGGGDEPPEEIRLEVRDSGPGVPEDARPVIFERFRQADGGSTRRHGGTGLGLSLARQFAEVQGGTVEVDDAPEGGARFTVTLPFRPTTETIPETEAAGSERAMLQRARLEAAGTSGGRIAREAEEARGVREEEVEGRKPSLLLVEDDEGLRDFLLPLLEEDYRVRTAVDGIEGLGALKAETPDLVLTDMMMPRMDGETFVREMRKRPELANVPVVVLTARAEPETVARLLELGAQDYLLKPVGLEELRARLENHLDMARSRSILQDELATREARLRILAGEATDRKRRLESLLEEKSVLIQELHHRVKGNLQTITSLLNLQARRIEDSEARDVLNQSRGRVAAMALLHERLYRTENPTETDMSAYVPSLVRDVFQSWGREGTDIRSELEVSPLQLDAERAVSCGLILHELLTNSLRHGFPDAERGIIRVRMRLRSDEPRKEKMIQLTVEDDGVGFPEGLDLDRADTLGVSLVSALVDQLGGEAKVTGRRGRGVRWEIDFPIRQPTAKQERTA